MTPLILAQAFAGVGLIQMLIIAVVILGVVAIVYVAARAMGTPIPQWVIQIVGIILVVLVAVFAIKLIAGML